MDPVILKEMAKDKKGINMEQISYSQKADICSLGTKQKNEIKMEFNKFLSFTKATNTGISSRYKKIK